jgi:hypothetical protein
VTARGLALAAAACAALALVPGGSEAQRPAAPPRFSHEVHAAKGVKVDACATCHAIAPDGRAAPPTSATPHQPCAASGCHEDQFFARTPTICVVCHDGTDPSVAQLARYLPRRGSEFGGEISHVRHATAVVPGGGPNGACVACHGDPTTKQAPPAGHALCGTCHAQRATPRMASCGGCHVRGATAAGGTRAASPWSVAARFDHTDHAADPRSAGARTRCVECHATVERATTPAQIAPPTMATCDGCHDGAKAFKTTGFGCAKCHGAGDAR